jgi:hypothetical protein
LSENDQRIANAHKVQVYGGAMAIVIAKNRDPGAMEAWVQARLMDVQPITEPLSRLSADVDSAQRKAAPIDTITQAQRASAGQHVSSLLRSDNTYERRSRGVLILQIFGLKLLGFTEAKALALVSLIWGSLS